MEKSITLQIAELRSKIEDVINDSLLVPEIKKMVLREYVDILSNISAQQLKNDVDAYNKENEKKEES